MTEEEKRRRLQAYALQNFTGQLKVQDIPQAPKVTVAAPQPQQQIRQAQPTQFRAQVTTPYRKENFVANQPQPQTGAMSFLGRNIQPVVKSVIGTNQQGDTRNFLSKAWDQVNQMDSGRSFRQNTPTTKDSGLTQYGKAVMGPLAGVQLRGFRTVGGAAEGASGLVDLVTPGTGTSRVTQNISKFNANLDKTAKDVGGGGAYNVTAVPAEVASFFVPSKAIATGASYIPKATKFISNVDKGLAKFGSKFGKVGKAITGSLKPTEIGTEAAITGKYIGEDVSKGREITPQRVLTDVLTGVGGDSVVRIINAFRRLKIKDINGVAQEKNAGKIEEAILKDAPEIPADKAKDISIKLAEADTPEKVTGVLAAAKADLATPTQTPPTQTPVLPPTQAIQPDVIKNLTVNKSPEEVKIAVKALYPKLDDVSLEAVTQRIAKSTNDKEVEQTLLEASQRSENVTTAVDEAVAPKVPEQTLEQAVEPQTAPQTIKAPEAPAAQTAQPNIPGATTADNVPGAAPIEKTPTGARSDYSPENLQANRQIRAKNASSITYADKKTIDPDELVTVYRAVPGKAKGGLVEGDWVTPNKEQARLFMKQSWAQDDTGAKIVTKKVRASELRYHADDSNGYVDDELLYVPQAKSGAPIEKTPQVGKPDPTAALKQEALKYGSAEEFVEAQGEPAYHRSQSKFDKFDISKVSNASTRQNGGWGLYFSDAEPSSQAYGNYLYEVRVPKDTLLESGSPVSESVVSKIVDAVKRDNRNPNELNEFSHNGWLFYKTLGRILGSDKKASLFLARNGVDGLKMNRGSNFNDYILFDDKSIKTKQQLTDLYNQAHTEAKTAVPKVEAPQPTVAPVREPKLAGKLDEIANYRTQIDSLKAAKTDMKEVVAEFVDDPTTGKQLISGIIDGQSYKMEVPPELAKAVMGLDQQKLPSVLKALAIVKKPFEVTWTGVLNPVFSAISFALYDTPMSVINSPQGFRTLGPKAVKESIKSIWSGSEFQRRLAAEGARPYGGSGASAFIKPDAKALAAQRNILTKIKYTSTNPEVALSKLDVWGGKLANATRTRIARAAYDDALRIAKKEGKDITDTAVQKRAMENATLAYRSVMPDFDTMSNLTRQINSVVPFYAASVAGTRSFGKALKRDPLGTGTKALALGIIPTVGITAFSLANPAGQDFYEEMERTNPRLLDENMVVVMPGAHKDDETGEWKGIVKVPLAPEFRAINRTTWRATRAAMGKGKGPEASHVAWSLFDAATGGVRSGENPLISTRRILSGEDPRTGERIIRGDMANLPKEEQMYESTSSAGKFVGNLLNTSPIQGDKILGQFGIVGQTAKNGGDPVEAVVGNVQNRFSGAYGESASRAFYDTYSPVKAKRDRVSKEVTTLIQSGRINEAKRKAEEFNSTLGGKFSEFSKEYSGSEVYDPAWDEMMSGLFIRTGERSIEARQRQ